MWSPKRVVSVSSRFALGVVLGLCMEAPAQAQSPPPAAPAAAVEVPTLSLSECLVIGLERRPDVRAARASSDAASLGNRGLDNLSVIATLARPDLAVRKKQSVQSILVARAGVEKSQHDAIYDVTRTYYTYVYARQQEQSAATVIADLELFAKLVDQLLKSPLRDPRSKVTPFALSGVRNLMSEVRLTAFKAELGRRQALVALKEAMGGDFDKDFVPRDARLPSLDGDLTKEQVIGLAMSRRPELVMAAAGSEAFRLEICAQMKARGMLSPTLGAGRDVHSLRIPMPLRDGEYRPGGILPEMPSAVVGKRDDRVARAAELSRRADAAAEQVTNLVRLEAENAFIAWEVSTKRVAEARKRYDNARKTLDEARIAALTQMDPDLMMTHATIAGRALADQVETTFEHLKALATLERVTGGGLQPAFPGR